MANYQVLFVRYGWAIIEADSEREAFQKAEGYGKEDVEWSDDFEVTNSEEVES